MKKKWALFLGILLLAIGILIRKTTLFTIEGMVVVILGVGFKVYYIVNEIKKGEYKPGYEMVLLFVGVMLFLTGIYLRSKELSLYPTLLISVGISLKLIFILLFIKKSRKTGSSPKP